MIIQVGGTSGLKTVRVQPLPAKKPQVFDVDFVIGIQIARSVELGSRRADER